MRNQRIGQVLAGCLAVAGLVVIVGGAVSYHYGSYYLGLIMDAADKFGMRKVEKSEEAIALLRESVSLELPTGYKAIGAFVISVPIPKDMEADRIELEKGEVRITFLGPLDLDLEKVANVKDGGQPTLKDDVKVSVFLFFTWRGPLSEKIQETFQKYAGSKPPSGHKKGQVPRFDDEGNEILEDETVTLIVGGKEHLAGRQVKRSKRTGDVNESYQVWLSPRAFLLAVGKKGHFDKASLDTMLATLQEATTADAPIAAP